jgi:hypothetical protein
MKKFRIMSIMCEASVLPLAGAVCSNPGLQGLVDQAARLVPVGNNVDFDNVLDPNEVRGRGVIEDADDLFEDRGLLNDLGLPEDR